MTTHEGQQPAINWPAMGQAVKPDSVAVLRQLIREARTAGRSIGGPLATHQWDLTQLNSVIDFSPADMLITAQAGCTLAGLQEQINAADLWLPLSAAGCANKTVGALVSGDSTLGWYSHRYGTAKDWITSIMTVDDRGQLVKSGAKVVKNVAGYNLTPLYQGSFDLLGPLVEMSFKLLPLPTPLTSCTTHWDSTAAMLAAWDTVTGNYFDWLALRLDGQGSTYQLYGLQQSSSTASDEQLPGAKMDSHKLDRPPAEPALPFTPLWQVHVLPAELRRLVQLLAGQDLLFTVYPHAGIVIGGSKGRTFDTDMLTRLRPIIGKFGQLIDLTDTGRRPVLSGAELALFQRVKRSLDPDGVFGPLDLEP